MNLAVKARMGLVLSLGVLAGLGLIVLPGIVAAPTHQTTYTVGASNSTSANNPGQHTASGSSNSTDTVTILQVNGTAFIVKVNRNSPDTLTQTNATSVVESIGDSRITLNGLSWMFIVIVVPAVAISLFVSFGVSRWGRRARTGNMEFDEPVFESVSEE